MIRIFRFAVIGLYIILIGTAQAQSGWKRTYNAGGSISVNFDDILYNNDHLVIRGNAYLNEDSIWSVLLCAIDTNGLLLWQQTIFDTSKTYHLITNTPSNFYIDANKKFIIPIYFFVKGELGLLVTDSLGNSISLHSYSNSERTIFPLDIISWQGHNYILGHISRLNYRPDVFVIRTDSLGQFEWVKYFGTIHYREHFGDVVNNADGTFTISANRYTDDFSLQFDDENWCSPWIFTIDTAGNMLDQWWGEENDERTLGGGPFYRMTDGSYILLSSDVIQAPFPYDVEWRVSPTITRLDSNYNLMWKRNMTDFEERFDKFVDLEYSPTDHTFVAAGEIYVKYGPNYYESEIWVVKFNEDGDILWNITDTVYFNRQELHYTAGLAIAPSGSIYVAGYVDKLGNEGWIMKVTPDGCTDTICTITSIADQFDMDKNPVRVYPNPSRDVIRVDIKKPGEQQRFIVYNMNGQIVLYQYIQDVSNEYHHDLPPGMYLYSVFDRSGLLDSGKFVVQ